MRVCTTENMWQQGRTGRAGKTGCAVECDGVRGGQASKEADPGKLQLWN